MPDDMLEDAISVSKKALEEHDFEEQGVEVSFHKQLKFHRLLKLLRSIWMKNGSHTGMYF